MTPEQTKAKVQAWKLFADYETTGRFRYKGLTYIKGVNNPDEILSKWKKTTIKELAEDFDGLMIDRPAYGFTIGRGDKLYWFITPYSSSGLYRCLGHLEGGGSLGWPRWCEIDQEIIIHYK